MIPLLDRLLGYYTVTVEQEHLTAAANALLSCGLSLRLLPSGKLHVPMRYLRPLRAAMGDIPYTTSPLGGVFGFVYRHRHCYGIAAALVCLLLCLFVSSRVVWDVRLEGEGLTDTAHVEGELRACGLFPGVRWAEMDFGKTETDLLSVSDTVGWVSIYRRGHVAYVTVAEKTVHEQPTPPVGYASVISAYDAVVDEVLVGKGYATVKKGDTVRAGDLLISGILPSEVGGGLCYAEGEVRGTVEQTVTVSVSGEMELLQTAKRTMTDCHVNFFGFSLNILKKYGKMPEDCAIIEENRTVRILGGYRLPICIDTRYAVMHEKRVRELTPQEMTALASEELMQKVRALLSDGELISIRTEGGFTEDGYTMRAYVTYRTVLGRTVPFSVQTP